VRDIQFWLRPNPDGQISSGKTVALQTLDEFKGVACGISEAYRPARQASVSQSPTATYGRCTRIRLRVFLLEVLRKMMIAGAEVSVVNLNMWRPARPVVGDALSLGCESGEGTHSCGRSGAGHGLAVATGQHGGFEPGQPFD
jgi:hypothetical protein